MRSWKSCAMALAIVMIITSAFIMPVQGATEAVLSSVSHSLSGSDLIITANVTNFAGYQEIKWTGSLTTEHKIVIDFTNCRLSTALAGSQISLNSSNVNLIRFGQYDETTARMVLEVYGTPAYSIKSSGNSVIVAFPGSASGGTGTIPDPAPHREPVGTPGKTDDFSIKAKLSNGEGYIAIDTSKMIKVKNEIVVNDAAPDSSSVRRSFFIDGVQLGNFIAMDSFHDPVIKYVKLFSGNGSDEFVGVSLNSASPVYTKPVYVSGEKLVLVFTSKAQIAASSVNTKIQSALADLGRININTISVQRTTAAAYEEVAISRSDYTGYSVTRGTNPDTVMVTIPNTSVNKTPINLTVNSAKISKISEAASGTSVRLTILLKGQYGYDVVTESGKIKIRINNVKYNNFTYNNNNDRVYYDIKTYALTDNMTASVKFYTEKWISADEYQITFNTPATAALRLGSGTLNINDNYLKWVSINENSSTGKTTVNFKIQSNIKIIIMTNRNGTVVKNTSISFIRPYKTSDKVIVIDPGHGGFNPAACNGDLYEKNVNLDMGIRVKKYLTDRGYKVFMTRETDVFVGLYERCYIANTLNAVIFMSIHNNGIISSTDVTGSETFYTEADLNSTAPLKSRDIARYVQLEMLSALGSKDRGYRPYNDLVVLKHTKMPAALAEVGFISSATESVKLADPAYRQKAAEAIARGLISSVKLLG